MLPFSQLNSHVSRRKVLAFGLIGAAAFKLGVRAVSADSSEARKLWLIGSAAEMRPPAPAQPSKAEIDELLELRDKRSSETAGLVRRWSTGTAILPWTSIALKLIKTHKPSPVRAGRALALLHAALNDAVIAALDAQAYFQRPKPATIEPLILPIVDVNGPSYSSEHAAGAGAAEVVLPYLFPDEPVESIKEKSEAATNSRVQAGANFRSDIAAGLDLGLAVGERAVARGKADGSDAEWDGEGRLTGEGYWEPTPPKFIEQPLDPLAGSWKTWVLESGDAMRPIAPPAYGSPEWEAELLAGREAVANRTNYQEDAVNYWAGSPGTVTPAGLWNELARDVILRHKLDTAGAAQTLAMMNVAIADAFICCWDAKFTYWTARPITADPTLDVLIPTPPFPSYTSGHSTISAAAATILSYVFPADAEQLFELALEAKNSRLWAGIHFPIDNDIGAAGGAQIGRLVAAAASE